MFRFVVLGVLTLCVGCTRSSPNAAQGADAGAPSSATTATGRVVAADASNSTMTLARNLGLPSSLAIDSTYVYFADAIQQTINRVPRNSGGGGTTTLEVVAKDQSFASNLTVVGGELVWSTKLGIFRISLSEKNPTIHTVREGSFAGVAVSDSDIFFIDMDAKSHCTLSRITRSTVATIADFDGQPTAMAADKTHAFVALSVVLGSSAKVLSAPRLPGVKKDIVTFNGGGLAELNIDGDQIFATGVVEKQQGLYRFPKSGGAPPALIAANVVPGIAASGDYVYFIGQVDHALHRVARSEGGAPTPTLVGTIPSLGEPFDLAVADGAAYIAGKEPAERGGAGLIARLAIP